MADFVSECKLCGSCDFDLIVTLECPGTVDEAGRLVCALGSNQSESVRCADCAAVYTRDNFADIDVR